ncbi:hypothetical protein [Roseobacter sp. CCS2]|uniref:hypothetical protein n=1 Tax=Roseobacter sp. CCS2 TaxID=391593 RepID=UPI0000F3F17B|nr:hypothetical protein [Roseobacter sp. CCS2]EBA11192.1 hypothetical protein RCCS2_10485 [Roseobacter sp. CCS2]
MVEIDGIAFAEMRVADEAGEDGFSDRYVLNNHMSFLRHIIGLIAALIFSALSVAAMPMAPEATSQAELFPHQPAAVAEHADVHFAARAPPATVANVAFTGAAAAERGNGIVMYGHEPHVTSLGFSVGLDATNSGPDGIWDRGQFTPIQRGNLIEDHLAVTEYSGWTRVGAQNNGFSPAFDFNQGSTWVSLKTVDTAGTGWQSSMRSHIDELRTWTSLNSNATKVLDIRVQSGGADVARSLEAYGAARGITVRINEF